MPVGMNRHTIWTRYYLPREFHRHFATRFSLSSYRALSLFMPPPYLLDYYLRRRRWCDRLGRLDDRIGQWPLLRGMGDHFLLVRSEAHTSELQSQMHTSNAVFFL